MVKAPGKVQTGCRACREDAPDFNLSMAFQPIFDMDTGRPFAFEALVRGSSGEGAAEILSGVTEDNRYAFDQQCRVAAIEQAVAAGLLHTGAVLSINFLPNAVYSPVACIQATLKAARENGLPPERIMFEFTENEHMSDTAHVESIIAAYASLGFLTAIDDFGAGHAGLSLLANLRTSHIKLDMGLVRGIDHDMPRQRITEAIVRLANELDVTMIAEGIETEAELAALRALGVRYLQGYLLARPQVGTLATAPLITLTGSNASA